MKKNSENELILKPAEKFCLTVDEASKYFEICDKKIRLLYEDHKDDGLFTKHGVKLLVLRPAFEKFLIETPSL